MRGGEITMDSTLIKITPYIFGNNVAISLPNIYGVIFIYIWHAVLNSILSFYRPDTSYYLPSAKYSGIMRKFAPSASGNGMKWLSGSTASHSSIACDSCS